jgi:D-alanyl-lipoteichoic acid acyltransferase DltB (MBOAT superfamily)
MLFNSFPFIFIFLPLTLVVYFFLGKARLTLAARAWLVAASLFFYGWWNPVYLPLIMASILFNYAVGTALGRVGQPDPGGLRRRLLLWIGVCGNIGLLGYYKYTDFLIANINYLSGSQIQLLKLILPLGISFFTFTQIAYLVDVYRQEAKEYDLLNYILFVTFFPHLIAGPIIHHKEMMPQFASFRNKLLNYKHLAEGLFLFSVGLFKKVIVADTFATWANLGFGSSQPLNALEAWCTSLSYTFQLYFDFSGYTDMALGSALMFNIKLPINFNSPYKALDIRDFWRRWHITLSRFLRDYVYIPLGGNRAGPSRTYFNLMATFLIGGIWHGAGWTFVFWGFLHGAAMVAQRAWQSLGRPMPKALAWFLTFNFINLAWVFFRARDWSEAAKVIKGMFLWHGSGLPGWDKFFPWQLKVKSYLQNIGGSNDTLVYLICALLVCLFLRNSNELVDRFKPSWGYAALGAGLAVYAVVNIDKANIFLYFNF